jgi:hypothetical protein
VIRVADGCTVQAKVKGKMTIKAVVDSGRGRCSVREHTLNNVYYVPNFAKTLVSVSTLVHAGHEVNINSVGCTVHHGKHQRVAFIARDVRGVYPMVTADQARTNDDVTCAVALSVLGTDLESWHPRLGHLNYKTLKMMAKMKLVRGLRVAKGMKATRMRHMCDDEGHHSLASETTVQPDTSPMEWCTPTSADLWLSREKATGSSWWSTGGASYRRIR